MTPSRPFYPTKIFNFRLLSLLSFVFFFSFLDAQEIKNSEMSFSIPFSSDEEEASVMNMSENFDISSLSEGTYLMILSKYVSGKSNPNEGILRDENDGLPLEVDCSNITNQNLQCRADLPGVDFDLPIIVHSQGEVILSALTIIPSNTGCPGDELIIPRTYFLQDDASMDQCEQTFTIATTDALVVVPPADVLLTCFTDSTDPASTGTPTSTGACSSPAPTYSYVDTDDQGYPENPIYTITRTWTVTDYCGRTNSAVQIIDIDSSIGCPAAVVPTMGEWGLIALFLSLMIFAVQLIRKKILSPSSIV